MEQRKGLIIRCADIKELIPQGMDWFNCVDLTVLINDDRTRGSKKDKNPRVKSSGRGDMGRPVVSSSDKKKKGNRIVECSKFQRSWVFVSLFLFVYLF